MSGPTIPGTAASEADLADLFPTAAPRNIAAGGGRTVRVLGNRVTYKAVAGQTGGAYSLFELVVEPGAGVPPHHGR